MSIPKLGSGKRFKALANKFAHKGINNPAALASVVGRKKYGKEKMQKMSMAGKRRKARHAKEDMSDHSY
jgi:hypothetical protein